MTATLSPHFVVTVDEIQVLASCLDVQSLPVVLGLRPQHDTETAFSAAVDFATNSLADRGLIREGEVAPEVAPLLRSLQRPERELAMRIVTPAGTARVAVVRQGQRCMSARRIGNEVTLAVDDAQATLPVAARALIRHLPTSAAAEVLPVGGPIDAVAQALSDTHDAIRLSDRIRALGAEPRTAMQLGSALGERMAFAEIVYYTLDNDEDRISRSSSAVGIFYTKRGRIVGAPSASPSGQLWTTLKTGSDHTIKQAISQLVELSTERWEEF